MPDLAKIPNDTGLEELFRALAANPPLHARFLNTVSFLEYVGARKIMKSQAGADFDLELLSHVAEESKHAWLVKRLAMKVDAKAARTYSPEHLLCPVEAEGYIQSIDAAAQSELEDFDSSDATYSKDWLNYLYTSLIIEERADLFYGVYAQVLEELGLAGTVRAILKDETKHLAAMESRIEKHDSEARRRLEKLRAIEHKAFGAWQDALWRELRAAKQEVLEVA